MSQRKRRSWEPAPQPPKPWHEQVAQTAASLGYAPGDISASPDQVTVRLPGGGVLTVTADMEASAVSVNRIAIMAPTRLHGGMRQLSGLLSSYARSTQGESGDEWPGRY
jgi:hypothetical protein